MKIVLLFLKVYIILLKIIKIKSKESNETKPLTNIAVIPFKTFYLYNDNINNSFTAKEYINIFHSSKPYIELEIGKNIKKIDLSKENEQKIKNNKQYISLFLLIDEYIFYIDDNYFFDERKKLICRYSTQLSTSYEINPSNNNLPNNMKDSVYATDYIKIFSDISLNKFNLIQIEFRHAFDITKNISFACGKVGLLVPSNKLYINSGTNFINQIHDKLESIDYSFTLQFNKSNKNIDEMNDGLLIIGAESIERNKNEELIHMYTKPNRYGSSTLWRFAVDQITIGNNFFEFKDEDFVIKADIEGIEIPYSFYNALNKIYFNNYYEKKLCQYEIVNNGFIVIFCDSKLFTSKDIQNFPQINLLKHKFGFNFTFSGEELFYKKENTYYFKMPAYLDRYRIEFNLGRLFLKKYKIIFNSDSKSMYFYKPTTFKNENIYKLNRNKKNSGLIAISYIFIGLLFLGVGLYFGKRFCAIKRKIHANELEDNNYIYESKEKGIKKEQKLLEL